MAGYTFEYTLTPRDIKFYQASWRRRRPFVLRSINVIGATVFGGAIGILAYDKLASPIDEGDFNSGFLWAFAAVLMFIAVLLGDRIFLCISIRRALRSRSPLFKPQSLTISPANVASRSALTSTELNWQAILDIIEENDAIYLSIDKNHALILPHDAIRDAGHIPDEVLRDMRAWRAEAPSCESRCPKCGYDLEGTTVQGCPECGWARTGGVADS